MSRDPLDLIIDKHKDIVLVVRTHEYTGIYWKSISVLYKVNNKIECCNMYETHGYGPCVPTYDRFMVKLIKSFGCKIPVVIHRSLVGLDRYMSSETEDVGYDYRDMYKFVGFGNIRKPVNWNFPRITQSVSVTSEQ